jgi:enoyl-CoA hydratase/carnithine racemase
MAESITKDHFPSQVASDMEKMSPEYGLKVAKAIENEWFKKDGVTYRFASNQDTFNKLRLYARGEQSVQKYKDELSINGDLSYLNLDWKPVPIIPKFVDIVTNGIAERVYDIKAYSQDPYGVSKRTAYMENLMIDMQNQDLNAYTTETFGVSIVDTKPEELPDSKEELELHMQLSYKQAIEIAEEQAISTILNGNRYELTRKRFYRDLTVLGIGAVKNTFSTSEGIIVDYVDPANLVFSYTEDPYFDDIYYVGEVKTIPINELVKQFPDLTQNELEEIAGQSFRKSGYYNAGQKFDEVDKNQIQVLYFNYKTYAKEIYKIKETSTGASKIIVKDESFDPVLDAELEQRFGKLEKQIEVLYEGALILGTDKLLKWELAKNMLRPKSDYTKVKMNYNIVAPRMYKGKIESLVSRITGFADMIQLTHLKLQQVLSRMVPDGIYMDADGLAEIDLGNGTNYNPQEALNMFFQTGSIIGRSLTSEGDMNPGKVPIQEIQSGAGGAKLQSLIQTYNYYLQMIRDVTGLNEARDASTPDAKALVGVQKIAAANSNTATRHILQAGLFLTAETAEGISLRISDIIEYSPTKEAFIQAIGAHNVATLEEMKELHLYDFGIFIELEPDEEEKQLLENNIQMALTQQSIDLEDAVDLRMIKNVKLANQLLKIRRKKKQQKDQQIQQENMRVQAEANAQAQQVAAQAEVEKNQAIVQSQLQLEQGKAQLESQKMMQEAKLKKALMAYEFQLNMQLKQAETENIDKKEKYKEDRKDERTRIQATQQSELIDQRNSGKPPKKFESTGNDNLGTGFDLGQFMPR